MSKQYTLVRTITFAGGATESLMLSHSVTWLRSQAVADCKYYNEMASKTSEELGLAISYAVKEIEE